MLLYNTYLHGATHTHTRNYKTSPPLPIRTWRSMHHPQAGHLVERAAATKHPTDPRRRHRRLRLRRGRCHHVLYVAHALSCGRRGGRVAVVRPCSINPDAILPSGGHQIPKRRRRRRHHRRTAHVLDAAVAAGADTLRPHDGHYPDDEPPVVGARPPERAAGDKRRDGRGQPAPGAAPPVRYPESIQLVFLFRTRLVPHLCFHVVILPFLLLCCPDVLVVAKVDPVVASLFDVLTMAAPAAVRGDGRPRHDAPCAGAASGVGQGEKGAEAGDRGAEFLGGVGREQQHGRADRILIKSGRMISGGWMDI
uniref:Uncharacterized protein n=1 Tax=Zea mays TaxID=4577 RepID=A0A804NXS9_MAIZE